MMMEIDKQADGDEGRSPAKREKLFVLVFGFKYNNFLHQYCCSKELIVPRVDLID